MKLKKKKKQSYTLFLFSITKFISYFQSYCTYILVSDPAITKLLALMMLRIFNESVNGLFKKEQTFPENKKWIALGQFLE